MAKKPPAEEVVPAPPPKAKKKRPLFIAACVLLLCVGGGAAWFLSGGKHGASKEAHANTEKPVKPEGPPLFLALESFTVNLQPQVTGQYLQTEMTLRVASLDTVDRIKTHMPEVRSRVLLLLSTKTAQELTTPAGKQKLAEEVRVEVTRIVDPEVIKPVEPAQIIKEPAEGAETAAKAASDSPVQQAEAAEPEAEQDPLPESPIRSVLFTSFIIQ